MTSEEPSAPPPSLVVTGGLETWGFFTSQPAPGWNSVTPQRPENVRQDSSHVQVAGQEPSAQFFRVGLDIPASRTPLEVVVVSAYPPFPVEAIAETAGRLRPACGNAALCLIVEDRAGWARMTATSGATLDLLAAAVALVKVSAGWDESDPVVVEVEQQAFAVSCVHREGGWQLSVTSPPRRP